MFADGVHAPSVSSLTQGRGLVKSASVRVPGRPTGAEKALKPVILSVAKNLALRISQELTRLFVACGSSE